MDKSLIIAEKHSVAKDYSKALGVNVKQGDGFLESDEYIFTWCIGHLVKLSYPEEYDESLKKWRLDVLPFLPEKYKYEVIKEVKKQFSIVKKQLNRKDVKIIYNAGDSAKEGEYIQRLVLQEAGYNRSAILKRIWIDSQTDEEIKKGIREAKPMTYYDNLADAGYVRAIEDYSIGINFSRALTLKYSEILKNQLNKEKLSISVGRVMTCVLSMIVNREREVRNFVKTPFYRIIGTFENINCEWKAVEGSQYYNSPLLYKENGFKQIQDANVLEQSSSQIGKLKVILADKKEEKKLAPLLYNLAELQADCAKALKISPDQTLTIAQSLYEKKMTTYPRTDARVLSTAIEKEISKNLYGLSQYNPFAAEILQKGMDKNINSKYVDDSKVSDHYAIIPTGQGFENYGNLKLEEQEVYSMIMMRFLSIFYPAAVFSKINIVMQNGTEKFFISSKTLKSPGYLKITSYEIDPKEVEKENLLNNLKVGNEYNATFQIKEGETTPPKRYDSGSMILAMENAGQLIEEDELREQIKRNGIGTSATRAEIIKKLNNNGYIDLNKKTQILIPTKLGEMIFEVVTLTIPKLLSPNLTASWEKGQDGIANGTVTRKEYMKKLEAYIKNSVSEVKINDITKELKDRCDKINRL